jgi:16S rRNA (cytidine1402-2'-O)-methyltransferase
LQEALGDRAIAVARELTKLHEEIFRGTLSQALSHFSAQPVRGEITLVIAGRSTATPRWSEAALRLAIQECLRRGETPSQIAGSLASPSGWPKREVYDVLLTQSKHQNSESRSKKS